MKSLPNYLVGILRDVLEGNRSDSVTANFSCGGVRNVERAYSLAKEYDIANAITEMASAGGRYVYCITIEDGRIEKQKITEFMQPSRG